MFVRMPLLTVVKLMDDENEDVCVISRKWIPEDEPHAYIPSVDGGKYHRLVRSHATLPPDTPKRPVDILIHTAIYDEAWRIQKQRDYLFPSRDGPAIMGLPVKRIKKYYSEEETTRKRAAMFHLPRTVSALAPPTSAQRIPVGMSTLTPKPNWGQPHSATVDGNRSSTYSEHAA